MPINNPTHPSALWTRKSLQYYTWLCLLGLALCKEYRFRYKDKTHSCEAHIIWLQQNVPKYIEDLGWTQPPQAMPDESATCSRGLLPSIAAASSRTASSMQRLAISLRVQTTLSPTEICLSFQGNSGGGPPPMPAAGITASGFANAPSLAPKYLYHNKTLCLHV